MTKHWAALVSVVASLAWAEEGIALSDVKEGGEAFQSELFGYARLLARLRTEKTKPNGERLAEYSDGRRPALIQQLSSTAPISKPMEVAFLTWSLGRLRETLGADDPFVKKVLGRESPEMLAQRVVSGSVLDDPAERKRLLEDSVIDVSQDPMLALAVRVDADARQAGLGWETQVDVPVRMGAERIAEARRLVVGAQGAPDATFTLRLSYGRVQGTASVPSLTTVGGLFERATGVAPFAVTQRWLEAKAKLPPKLPYNLATTNDIIGGNSGSPLLDAKGDVVGLVFDGNLASLGGRYGYEPATNRAVAVHGSLILSALEHVYGAPRLVRELTGP